MGKLRIGIIGCGRIANQKHFPAMKNNTDLCKMVAFCDIIEDRAKKACEEYGAEGAKYYTDYHDLLDNRDVEVVHICTPNVSHCEITIAAFEARKHVYVEKPMSHSTEEAEKMTAAWRKSGMQFTVGYQNRFRPEVLDLHAACEAGDLGDIYYARTHAIFRRAVPAWGEFPNKALQGGGPLIDIGTHALDISLWCMNNYDVESISGQIFYKLGRLHSAEKDDLYSHWDPDAYEVEDSAMGFIKMKNGALVNLETAWAINMPDFHEGSTTFCGTLAGAEIHTGMSCSRDKLFSEDCRQWLTAIRKGTGPLVKPEEALVVTRILDNIYRAAEQKKEVRF